MQILILNYSGVRSLIHELIKVSSFIFEIVVSNSYRDLQLLPVEI
jgi:hypothetical protein